MRVTGGEFCGRILAVPGAGAIRPTQDRVRAALFNILAPEIAGAEFLDLFAGSGAVGIEALSRGSGRAVFVERDRRNLAVLKGNLEMLGAVGRAETVAADAYRWVASYSGGGFGVAFADPPYALGEERGYVEFLATLAARGVVVQGGIFAAEMTVAQCADEAPGWELLRNRVYGGTRLCVWRRVGQIMI